MIYSCLAEHGTKQRNNAAKSGAEVLQLPLEAMFITPGGYDDHFPGAGAGRVKRNLRRPERREQPLPRGGVGKLAT